MFSAPHRTLRPTLQHRWRDVHAKRVGLLTTDHRVGWWEVDPFTGAPSAVCRPHRVYCHVHAYVGAASSTCGVCRADGGRASSERA